MTQELFPEIKEAIDALEKRVSLTEAEIAEMKEGIKEKKAQVKTWRKALAAFTPRKAATKKKAIAA
jgi:prefoldin subunit 5